MGAFEIIVFISIITLGYGLVSKKAEKTIITAPMVFVSIGFMVSPSALKLIDVDIETSVVQVLAEITLISILFVDASMIDLKKLRQDNIIPVRLLLIGLPVTMLLGWGTAYLMFPGFGLILAGMLAFILSPTDAALGQAVVKSKLIPEKIRQGINVESGINDGMVLPPILLCISLLAINTGADKDWKHWLGFVSSQLILGPAIGALFGWLGGWLIDRASTKNWMNQTYQRLGAISLAVIAYAGAELFHGNGYIAAFFAGLFLGIKTHSVRERIQEYGEAEGQQLTLFVFLIFGMVMVPKAIPYWDIESFIYAILSLSIIRILPVFISLTGKDLSIKDILFLGWFGPRGIASILYLEMVVRKLGLFGYEKMLSVVVLTILMSVMLHGLSAVPLSKVYK